MTTATTKDAIASVISGASGTDKVWTRERNPITEAAFREAFTSQSSRGPVLHAWEIHWLRSETEQMGCGEEDEYNHYRLRGYLAWKDDGEADTDNSSDFWDTVLENVRAEFRGEQTLDGTVEHCEPITLTQNIYVEAFKTFCHFAEFELSTRTRVSVTYS